MTTHAIGSESLVREARSLLRRSDADTIREQIRLVSIPAPSGHEGERGAYVRHRFEAIGLRGVATDEVGNVLAYLPSLAEKEGDGGSAVMVTAHLDTIFPAGTAIDPQRDGARIAAPGITDNARGLAAMLAIARTLRETGIETEHPLLFVATVGEEGIGDLRGVKHLFRPDSPFLGIAAFISLDGAGVTRIVNQAIGSVRLRATVHGLGGHSWGDRGLANPAHALGRAIARLSSLGPPGPANFAVTVGRMGGGTSVNAIPEEAWLELDLRSDDAETLDFLVGAATEILEGATREEIRESAHGIPLVLAIDRIGDRPCGTTLPSDPLVEAACAATRFIGATPELGASSTDANVPISLGIPALAMGAGGQGGGIHTLDEWFENDGGALGIERALLTVLTVAGIRGSGQGR